MTSTFQFDDFTLRPATEADLPLARAWNAADPDHVWEMGTERYWIRPEGGWEKCSECFVLEDFEPVFFLRTTRIWQHEQMSIEISIQFNRADLTTPLWRTMNGMLAGMKWLERTLPANGIHAIYFSSKSERLIRFAQVRLGFSEVENFGESLAMGFRRFRKII